ncbi:MAG TPA: YbaK/EbsC family protein [Solirubrobacteraceae bacterium]|nr:YbaK/EbsC family protein [Solirubrobacteraceae bacterium]
MTERQTSGALETTGVDAITDYLRGERVAYELLEHEPVMSAAAEAGAAHVSAAEVAKTIVLHDGNAYVIAAVPASMRLDLRKLRALLGATRRLRLASEAEIARDFPRVEVGALPPFGPMLPAAEVLDSELLDHPVVLCPAGDHRHSVLVSPHEIMRITAARSAAISMD